MKSSLGTVVVVFLSWTILGNGGSASESTRHASIKSTYGQLVTSSTLRWREVNGLDIVNRNDAVPSGTGDTKRVICRSEHHGTLLVGQTTILGSHCRVGFVNKILSKHKFEILVNVDQGAKLEWQVYSKFAGVPEGSVAGVDDVSSNTVFIGRHLIAETGEWVPGSVEVPNGSPYSAFGVMRVFDTESGTMQEWSTGDVLVEVEPVRYELEIRNDNDESIARRPPKTTRQDIVLVKDSLFRFEEGRDVEARLQKALYYKYDKSEYYGQVPGMIRALPTQVKLHNGQVQSLRWGIQEVSSQQETLMVGHMLKHNTAVDVSIVGVRITEETPYKAILTTVFKDGSQRKRNIDGVSQRKYLNNIRPEYSRVYQIKDSYLPSNAFTTARAEVTTNSYHRQSEVSVSSYNRSHRGSSDAIHHGKNTVVAQGMSEVRGQQVYQNSVNDQEFEHRKRERMLGDDNKQLLMSPVNGCGSSGNVFTVHLFFYTLSLAILVSNIMQMLP